LQPLALDAGLELGCRRTLIGRPEIMLCDEAQGTAALFGRRERSLDVVASVRGGRRPIY
jgi:hypothetical protein